MGSGDGFGGGLGASSTAEFLEVAVASGDLVPGRWGWKARQQELVRAHLDVPQAGLLGQTLAQVILTALTQTGNLNTTSPRKRFVQKFTSRFRGDARSWPGDTGRRV